MADTPGDGTSTPTTFTSHISTAEELLKTQTIGLVSLSDYRKRHAEAKDAKEREQEQRLQSGFTTSRSGSATPSDGVTGPQPPKKKRKAFAKGKLSFGLDDEEGDESAVSTPKTPRSITPAVPTRDATPAEDEEPSVKRRLGPNASVTTAPRIMTKSALQKEAQTREMLRKEYLLVQEAVKASDILVPFVFYDGSNIPGGRCRVKKGDHIWLFLDRARKVGAETGAGGGDKSRREWARVGVDDLMLVKGEIIIPHHYDFYHFILNQTQGFDGPIFNYASRTSTTNSWTEAAPDSEQNPISRPAKGKTNHLDEDTEGYHDDPSLTKVVDRRWYEKNKHIFPASIWEEYDPNKDYTKGMRKDTEGNSFFFNQR